VKQRSTYHDLHFQASRSFDEARNAVRFIGHDGMFAVEAGALAKSNTDLHWAGASETNASQLSTLCAQPSTMLIARLTPAAAYP
jgi:hypothetical protein